MGRGLVIPDSGVLRTGRHNIAFIDRGGGYLQPAEVQLGAHIGGRFVVLNGLKEGDRIVSSANFLVDSESQLQAALEPSRRRRPAPVKPRRLSASIEIADRSQPAAQRR